jgi:hypothetical protein
MTARERRPYVRNNLQLRSLFISVLRLRIELIKEAPPGYARALACVPWPVAPWPPIGTPLRHARALACVPREGEFVVWATF